MFCRAVQDNRVRLLAVCSPIVSAISALAVAH